jgi:hypothetical protein
VFQVVESRRVDGKVRQKVLLVLGDHSEIQTALDAWERELQKRTKRVEELEPYLNPVPTRWEIEQLAEKERPVLFLGHVFFPRPPAQSYWRHHKRAIQTLPVERRRIASLLARIEKARQLLGGDSQCERSQ